VVVVVVMDWPVSLAMVVVYVVPPLFVYVVVANVVVVVGMDCTGPVPRVVMMCVPVPVALVVVPVAVAVPVARVVVVSVPVPVVVRFLGAVMVVFKAGHLVAIFTHITRHGSGTLHHIAVALGHSRNHAAMVGQVLPYQYLKLWVLSGGRSGLLANIVAHNAGKEQVGQYDNSPRPRQRTPMERLAYLGPRHRLEGHIYPPIVAPFPEQAPHLEHLGITIGVATAAPHHQQRSVGQRNAAVATIHRRGRPLGQRRHHRGLCSDRRSIGKRHLGIGGLVFS